MERFWDGKRSKGEKGSLVRPTVATINQLGIDFDIDIDNGGQYA